MFGETKTPSDIQSERLSLLWELKQQNAKAKCACVRGCDDYVTRRELFADIDEAIEKLRDLVEAEN